MKLLNELQDLLVAALKEDDNTNCNDDVTMASSLEVKFSLVALTIRQRNNGNFTNPDNGTKYGSGLGVKIYYFSS